MFSVLYERVSILKTVLQRSNKIFINNKNYVSLLYLRQYSESTTESSNKSVIKNSGLIQISSELTKPLEGSQFRQNYDDLYLADTSWKTIKYSLLFIGLALVGTGSYILVEFGKPNIGQDGKAIPDEFSGKPKLLQYIYRSLRELEQYKRMIREPSREKLLPDELKPPYYQPPYTLVVELMDVLVHPDWTYNTGWRFKKRPGVDYFLETLSNFYEIVIYTAEQGMTVFPIVEALDPKNTIMYKLVRDATHFVEGHHVKNLDKLNRNLNKVVVVDWNRNSVKFHPDNVFCIPKWDGNDNDTTLIDLTALLLTMANSKVQDVRDVLSYYNSFDDSLGAFKDKQRIIMEQQETLKQNKPLNPAVILSKNLFTNTSNLSQSP